MKIENQDVIKRQVLPQVTAIKNLLDSIYDILKPIRREGSGQDMTLMTSVINHLMEAGVGIQKMDNSLKEIIQKEPTKV